MFGRNPVNSSRVLPHLLCTVFRSYTQLGGVAVLDLVFAVCASSSKRVPKKDYSLIGEVLVCSSSFWKQGSRSGAGGLCLFWI